MNRQAQNVLDFWFGSDATQVRAEWFRKDAAFDARIAERFRPLIDDALAGAIDAWATEPLPALARVIVLDQFTRNIFRGTAEAFAGDPLALAAARAIVQRGWDRALTGVQRQFVYLPFEHAEDLGLQQEALRLFGQLAQDEPALAGLLEWARKHHDVIARFGRFPHRNAALARPSTSDEDTFLAQPGSHF